MSFGSGSGFGFGSNTNTNNNSGGFGFGNTTNTNTTGGFGSTPTTGFGANNATSGGSLFGNNATNNTTPAFGASSTGFGSNSPATGGFGAARPAFGSSTTSLFGANNNNNNNNSANTALTTTGGFGGFGANNNTSTPSTGFGGGTGSLFGSNTNNNTASGFGNTTNATGGGPGGGLFGAGASTGFGGAATTTNTGFGSTNQPPNTGFGNGPLTFGSGSNAPTNNGTGGTPFQPVTEKDGATTNGSSHFQSITFQQPYKDFSFEELRVVDYQQNRKGGTGAGSGFGGGFTASNTTNNAFGSTPAASGGFGASNNSGGFGATPASTGFGSAPKFGGGIFGNNNTSGGVLGNTNNTSSATSTLFGSTPTKSAFGSTPATSTGGFGTSNSTTAFGANQPATGSLFGGNTGGGFGASNNANPAPTSSPFGGFGGNSNTATGGNGGFGSTWGNNNNNNNNQPKPSIFGGANTGTSLFPANNMASTSNMFNNNNNNQPNNSGGGLFGANNNQNQSNNTGGLFNNTNNNQTGGGSLFGASTLGQPKPNPFNLGGSTNNNGSTGLFNNQNQNNNQNSGSSLFGNPNQQPQPNNSLFGGSHQQPQQPQQLMTSIMQSNPYGNESIFASLSTPQQPIGPLATPLSGSQSRRKPAPLPAYKLNPAASSRLITPQKRDAGYGLSYSTYGTPGSGGSAYGSPNYYGGLLGGGSMGRSLNKSLSTSNLRNPYSASDSILNPNAFSPSNRSYRGSGTVKKLHIDRSMRTDLFGSDGSTRASPLKKMVSFEADKDNSPGTQTNGDSRALVRVEDNQPSKDTESVPEKVPANNGPIQPEMEQVKGNELAIVPEDGPAPPSQATKTPAENAAAQNIRLQIDQPLGKYYTKPTASELSKMSRQKLKEVKDFVIGREGAGSIKFDQVNLEGVDLDRIIGDVVKLETRCATVYAEEATKVPVGKGFNVPSTITLSNSWPRSEAGKRPVFERKGPKFDKHVLRLKRVAGTQFLGYNLETGEWTFRVEHFSTYEFPDEDEEEDFTGSMLSSAPVSEHQQYAFDRLHPQQALSLPEDVTMVSNVSSAHASNIDDTFEFRRSKMLPGAFDTDIIERPDYNMDNASDNSLSRERLMEQDNAFGEREQSQNDVDPQFSGSFPGFDGNTEMDIFGSSPEQIARTQPKSILKVPKAHPFASPESSDMDLSEHWADQLQRTLSPKKQDRQALRVSQGHTLNQRAPKEKAVTRFTKESNPFATSIDVMNSLFGNAEKQVENSARLQSSVKRKKLNVVEEADRVFRQSFKSILNVSNGGSAKDLQGIEFNTQSVPEEDADRVSTIEPAQDFSSMYRKQRELTDIAMKDNVPFAKMKRTVSFADFASAVEPRNAETKYEKIMWELAQVLFDSQDPTVDAGNTRLKRKETLSQFWKSIVTPEALNQAQQAKSAEDRAFAFLSGLNVWDATEALLQGDNLRLATMLSQIGGDEASKQGMREQIDFWRESGSLGYIPDNIRVFYELLSGNVGDSQGSNAVGQENQAKSFNISSRFGLDWRRAFGMRLWYGIDLEDPISEAVMLYSQDLEFHDEEPRPIPWFETSDAKDSRRVDILWSLLCLYGHLETDLDSADVPDIDLADILSSSNLSTDPKDVRMSFQLCHALRARQIVDFKESTRPNEAEALATNLAIELGTSAKTFVNAVFVSLHLTDSEAREKAIKTLLDRHSSAIGDGIEVCSIFGTLVEEFQIPSAWIWSAKARYVVAASGDPTLQVQYLLKAGNLRLAHDTLKSVVAPRAIIEEDLQGLKALLQDFEIYGVGNMNDWKHGGHIFAQYVSLLDSKNTKELVSIAQNLRKALPKDGAIRSLGLEERVAVCEIWNVLKKLDADPAHHFKEINTGLEPDDDSTLQAAMRSSERYFNGVAMT